MLTFNDAGELADEGDVLAQLHFFQVLHRFGPAEGQQGHVAEALVKGGFAQACAGSGVGLPPQGLALIRVIGEIAKKNAKILGHYVGHTMPIVQNTQTI